MNKDLLGRKIKKRKNRLEMGLKNYDLSSFAERLERLKWLVEVHPDNAWFATAPETYFVFSEVKNTFVDGSFVATLLLCLAFIEHWLACKLISRGFENEAKEGLNSMLKCLKRERLMHDYLIKKVDRLRKLRNPFAHLKSIDHPYSLPQRMYKENKHPMKILEEDAKEAVSLMYTISVKIGFGLPIRPEK
jgi:hypothetical protein